MEDKYPERSGGGFPSVFLRGATPQFLRVVLRPPRALLEAPRIFSNVFTNLRSNAVLSFSQQPRPSLRREWCAFARAPVCVCVYVCMCVTSLASARVCEQRRVLLFSALHRGGGGIHFAAQRPRLPRTAPFDCFDYPYLIPRSSSPGRFPTDSRLEASSFLPSFLSFDLDSPFSFRHAEKHRLDTSRRRRVARDAKSLAKIHRRKYA